MIYTINYLQIRFTNPSPITVRSLKDLKDVDKVYIDDMDGLIKKLFPCKV